MRGFPSRHIVPASLALSLGAAGLAPASAQALSIVRQQTEREESAPAPLPDKGEAEPGGYETLTVTALRLQAPFSAASLTRITREDIARIQAVSALDAIRGVPGVTVSANGGPGQTSAVFLRGVAGSNQTLVLVDGAPVNDPSAFGGFNFAFLDASAVERIEILRGAGSAIWGSEAIGGVISIVTRREEGLSAAFEAGSFGTAQGELSGGIKAGQLRLTGTASIRRSAGFSAFNGGTERDGARIGNFLGRLLWDAGAGIQLDLGVRSTRGFTEFDEFQADSEQVSRTRQNLFDAALRWRSPGGTFRLSTQGLYARTQREFPGGFFDHFSGERVLGRFEAEARPAEEFTLLIGADLEGLTTRAAPGFAGFSGGSRQSRALFALYRGVFFDRLTLEGAIRQENEQSFGARVTGEAGGRIALWPGANLRGNWAEGFRAPSVDEITGGGFARPNPELAPEQSAGWEIGFDQSIGTAWKFDLVWFRRDVRDQIVFDFDPLTFDAVYTNLARNRAEGVELSGTGTWRGLRAGLSYSLTRAFDRDTGLQNVRIPRHQGAIDLDFTGFQRLSFGGRLFLNGRERDFAREVGGFVRLDLHAGYRLTNRLEVTLAVENSTDSQYEDVADFGTAGISGFLGLRLRLL